MTDANTFELSSVFVRSPSTAVFPGGFYMKKIGIIIFLTALLLSVFVSRFFSVGRFDEKIFSFSFNSGVKGSGNPSSETREVGEFSGVDVGGVFQVEITAQQEFGFEIEADDNLLPLIRTEVRDGVLWIETDEKISPNQPLRVRVSAPDINKIAASGVSKVSLSAVKNDELHVDTSGASKVNITGETANLIVEVSGASKVDAGDLKAGNAKIDASGASHVDVFAVNDLRSDASGASKIVYTGSPKNVEKNASGAGSIRQKK
jgi:hypothetical protein